MSRYTATTPDDLREMLATIGVASLDELFERQVPAGVRLERPLDLPLRRDPGVVGAVDPLRALPAHPSDPDADVLDRRVQRVPHV